MPSSSVAGATIPRSTVIGVVAATMIAQLASVMAIATFPVIAPRLAAEMGVDAALVGYQMSLIYGAATITAPILSMTVVRWGACRAMQAGLAFCVLGAALAFASHILALVACSIMLGLSITMMTPTSAHLLMRFTPPRNRVFLFSLKQTGVPLGWAIMASIAPAITEAYGWRWSLAIVACVSLATIIALQPVRERWDDDRDPAASRHTRVLQGVRMIWNRPTLRWMVLSAFALAFVQLCLGTFAVNMLVKESGYTLVSAGFMLSVTQLSGVLARLAWGWLADRTGDSLTLLRNLAVVAMLCCPTVALITPAWPTALVMLVFAVFGASAIGWNGVYLAEVAHRSPPGEASLITGGASAWNFAGILVGPAVFATVYGFIGSYAVTYVLLGLLGISATTTLTLALAAARKEAARGKL
jgi:predicted MFS family arabinose efflux permease